MALAKIRTVVLESPEPRARTVFYERLLGGEVTSNANADSVDRPAPEERILGLPGAPSRSQGDLRNGPPGARFAQRLAALVSSNKENSAVVPKWTVTWALCRTS